MYNPNICRLSTLEVEAQIDPSKQWGEIGLNGII